MKTATKLTQLQALKQYVCFRNIQYIQDDGRKLEVYFTDGGLFTISPSINAKLLELSAICIC